MFYFLLFIETDFIILKEVEISLLVPGLDALQLSILNTHKIFYTVILRTFLLFSEL